MSNKLVEFQQRTVGEYNICREDVDKMLFALSMVIKRTEDNEDMADSILHAYLDGKLGETLTDLIDIELIEDASSTITFRMGKGE